MAIITAHSGCDRTEDNSVEFIEYALASEADCLEVDVRENWKGELILAHDENGGKNPFLQKAFELLRKHPEKKINCDLKRKGLEGPVYRLASEMGVEQQLIYSGEVNPSFLEKERGEKFPGAEIYMNIENIYPKVYEETGADVWPVRMQAALSMAAGLGVRCVNMEYSLFTEGILAMIRKEGLKGSAWTVNDTEEIRRLLSREEIENVTTRNLKAALTVREEMKNQ